MLMIGKKEFDPSEILKYGDKLEISGMLLGNGQELELMLFPETTYSAPMMAVQPTHAEWKELLLQLDTLGVEGLNKIILRKSQRNIEQTISWNVFRRDKYTCQYCGNNHTPLTVDHLVLWEKMGASVEENLVSACKKCNKTRGNIEYKQWLKNPYLLKALEGFGPKEFQLRQLNYLESLWEPASKVPLRPTQRSR